MDTRKALIIYAGTGLVCYHGSSRDFNKFDPEAESNVWDADYPDGVMFFTNTKARAQLYGKYVYTCRLNVTNVKSIKAPPKHSPERFIDNNSEVFNHLFQDSDCIAVIGQGQWQGIVVYATFSDELIEILDKEPKDNPKNNSSAPTVQAQTTLPKEPFRIPIQKLLIRKDDVVAAVGNLHRGYPSMTQGPLEVAYHPKQKRYELVNGYHRLVEALLRGETEVTVQVKEIAEWGIPPRNTLYTPDYSARFKGLEEFNEVYELKRI